VFGGDAHMTMTDVFKEELRAALQRACQAQNDSVIMRGRREILAMPREEVLEHIERVSAAALPLGSEWEFRRLLELYEQLDRSLLQRLVESGRQSENPEIREAAADFSGKL
jgi:hypothetical protein